jgi:hypothetical protein
MRNLYIQTLFVLTCIATSFGQNVNTNISNNQIFNGEPYIAINPINKQNIVIAWMGYKFINATFKISIVVKVSMDGGNTWSAEKLLPHMGSKFGSADVSMDFTKKGLLYLSYIDHKESPDSGGVYISRSKNGGMDWDMPSKVLDIYEGGNKRPLDRPWIAVDKSNTSKEGTIYITTKPAPWITGANRNYYKVSSDSGYTWTALANVDGGSYLIGSLIAAPMASPAVTINGDFVAAYPSYVTSQNVYPCMYLAKSDNKGVSFSYTDILCANPAKVDSNLKNGYHLSTHPTDSQRMMMTMIQSSAGDEDITLLTSSNGGNTWTAPVRVNDDTLGNSKSQDMAWSSYNEKGHIVVTWRDRRASVKGFWNAKYDFYYATSTDNGVTFSKNQKISSQELPFDSILTQNGNDMMCNVFVGDTLYAVWGDTRSGKMNVFFSKTVASTNTNVGIIQLNQSDSNFEIYPTIGSEILTIECVESLLPVDLETYNMDGKKVLITKMSAKKMSIQINTLVKGKYIVKLGNTCKSFMKE